MKHLLKETFSDLVPSKIINRRDKMGFPVPLKEWMGNELKDFVGDIFQGMAQKNRPYVNVQEVLKNFDQAGRFSRKVWSLLSLEIWHQAFHDRANYFRSLLKS